MSVNSSSSTNVSLPPSSLPSSLSIYIHLYNCFNSRAGTFSNTTFTILIILLLPLYILILYLGLQRWRTNTTMTHSDLFTYNMVITELLSVFGFTLCCCGVHTVRPEMIMVGIFLFNINFNGQMFFHTLTCVERYLAVVHPITYLSLRKAKGIRIRNITIGCVWLLCFAWTGLIYVEDEGPIFSLYFCVIAFILSVTTFCSLSILYVLIRPGPGEGGGGRQRVDQSKLRAFYTIMVILGVLLFRFGGNILTSALYFYIQTRNTEKCGVWLSAVWFSLPSSLVLPLLFLHRAGKLLCCKNNKGSGRGSD